MPGQYEESDESDTHEQVAKVFADLDDSKDKLRSSHTAETFEARLGVERGMYFVQLGCKLQTMTSMVASHEVGSEDLRSTRCASAHIFGY
jgi:predicted transcriptional regulator